MGRGWKAQRFQKSSMTKMGRRVVVDGDEGVRGVWLPRRFSGAWPGASGA